MCRICIQFTQVAQNTLDQTAAFAHPGIRKGNLLVKIVFYFIMLCCYATVAHLLPKACQVVSGKEQLPWEAAVKRGCLVVIVALMLASCSPMYPPWGRGGGGGCAQGTATDSPVLVGAHEDSNPLFEPNA